ncbi:MAG: hypothetical protein J6Y42_03300 [Bacilli bacterium]|nr:hypothetical protein [Bacilli bacterium]
MTKNEFFEIAKNNIHFRTRKERKEFFEFYNDLIIEMKESGETEEEAVSSFNINEIIEQYNSNNKIDYEYETKLNLYKKDLKIYLLSILIGFILPVLYILAYVIPTAIETKKIVFNNYGMKVITTISLVFFYFAYLRINEVYYDIKIIKKRKKENKRINVYIILCFVAYFLLNSAIEWLAFYLLIAGENILLILLTSIIIIPFIIYFIIRRRRIKNGKNK